MKVRIATIVAVACLLAVSASARYVIPTVNAIGLANVVVTSVYWGTNPMDPTTAHPGDVNAQLSIIITNVGDDVARGVNATLLIGPPLTYTYYAGDTQYNLSSTSKVAGDMAAGASFTLAYTVSVDPNAKQGIYRYDLQVSYKSARELQQINNDLMVDVPLWNGELHIQNVVTVPTKVYPDSKQVAVKVFIVNSGRGEAKDLQLRLALAPPFTASSSGSDSIYVGNILSGQTAEADFVVDVAADAQFGQYEVVLGEQTGNNLIPIGQVPLYLAEKVNFDIVSVTPTGVHAGDSGDVIKVEIKNAGSVKADSVRVEMRVGNFFTGTLTDFLGTMLAGETKVAFFTVDIDSKAQPGQYALDLRFDWTQDNNSLDNTQSITLTVTSPGVPTSLIIVAVIVIAGAGGYFFLRKRRMKAAGSTKK
ncbi:MAG: hypothetical protein WB661_00010 [Candidatus Bathyarchaeia archaeon]